MGDRTQRSVRDGMAVLAALAVAAFLQPLPAVAAHNAGEVCYGCHTLDVNEGDPGTSLINKLSRTFPRIKDYDGLPPASTPENLGCTYCHNDNGRTDKMLPALTHFQGRTSFHPVGRIFVGAGTDTNNEYLSTFGSTTPQELDCVDCHDLVNFADGQDDVATDDVDEGADGNPATSKGGPEGKYPEHGPPVDAVNNPFMLKNVTAANEYDGLCRTCHRSDAAQLVKGVSMQLLSHADNAALRPIVETDGTVLRTADLDGDGIADTSGLATTAQCTVCHDTHFSTNRRLFNDGHEKHKTGTGMVTDTAVTSGGCTTFCHYAGDEKNINDGGSYYKYGHGMAQSTYRYKGGQPDATGNFVTLGYNCTSCHVGIDPAQKAHADKNPSGTDQEKYIKRFNLSGTMQSGDTGSAMGNPLVGICFSCHQGYDAHKTVSHGGVGCQDCHDEHAEGSGINSNVMMIPEKSKKVGFYVAPDPDFATKPGTEKIVYDSTKWDTETQPYVARSTAELDFFRQGDANGICDTAECHAGKSYTPLDTWIDNAATTHSGGRQTPGSDCGSCHQHSGDPGGGWRATMPP